MTGGTTRAPLRFCAPFAAFLLAACEAPLSTLDPAGPIAASVARLWWAMLAGSVAILALVLALLALAFRRARRETTVRERAWLIGGGLVFPGLTLTVLLAFALLTGERWMAVRDVPRPVEAVAERWSWSFRHPDGPDRDLPVLVMPLGEDVHVEVSSVDVIHSFWIPRLAGKIDAIPGHVNLIRLRADELGVYRGQCSEFCGLGHAWMDFVVEVHPPEAVPARLAELAAAEEVER